MRRRRLDIGGNPLKVVLKFKYRIACKSAMFQEFRTKAALRTALLAIRKGRGEDAGRDAALSARLAQLLIEYAPRGAAGGEQRACAVEFLSLDTGIKNEKRTLPDSGAR